MRHGRCVLAVQDHPVSVCGRSLALLLQLFMQAGSAWLGDFKVDSSQSDNPLYQKHPHGAARPPQQHGSGPRGAGRARFGERRGEEERESCLGRPACWAQWAEISGAPKQATALREAPPVAPQSTHRLVHLRCHVNPTARICTDPSSCSF